MTVILPGMTEDDQRVKISSADPKQQGIMDLWKSKVRTRIYFRIVGGGDECYWDNIVNKSLLLI